MIKTYNTNVKLDEKDFEDFQILNIRRKKKNGDVIGALITEEVRRNREIIDRK